MCALSLQSISTVYVWQPGPTVTAPAVRSPRVQWSVSLQPHSSFISVRLSRLWAVPASRRSLHSCRSFRSPFVSFLSNISASVLSFRVVELVRQNVLRVQICLREEFIVFNCDLTCGDYLAYIDIGHIQVMLWSLVSEPIPFLGYCRHVSWFLLLCYKHTRISQSFIHSFIPFIVRSTSQ